MRSIPWAGTLRPGDRVVCQPITDRGFGKVDRLDVGTVEADIVHVHGAHDLTPCLVVRWDQDGAVDMITDSGRACHWDYQVIAALGCQEDVKCTT